MLHVTYKTAIVAWPYHRIGEVTLHYVYYKDDEDPVFSDWFSIKS